MCIQCSRKEWNEKKKEKNSQTLAQTNSVACCANKIFFCKPIKCYQINFATLIASSFSQ